MHLVLTEASQIYERQSIYVPSQRISRAILTKMVILTLSLAKGASSAVDECCNTLHKRL